MTLEKDQQSFTADFYLERVLTKGNGHIMCSCVYWSHSGLWRVSVESNAWCFVPSGSHRCVLFYHYQAEWGDPQLPGPRAHVRLSGVSAIQPAQQDHPPRHCQQPHTGTLTRIEVYTVIYTHTPKYIVIVCIRSQTHDVMSHPGLSEECGGSAVFWSGSRGWGKWAHDISVKSLCESQYLTG